MPLLSLPLGMAKPCQQRRAIKRHRGIRGKDKIGEFLYRGNKLDRRASVRCSAAHSPREDAQRAGTLRAQSPGSIHGLMEYVTPKWSGRHMRKRALVDGVIASSFERQSGLVGLFRAIASLLSDALRLAGSTSGTFVSGHGVCSNDRRRSHRPVMRPHASTIHASRPRRHRRHRRRDRKNDPLAMIG
jgi:hypothetical protein